MSISAGAAVGRHLVRIIFFLAAFFILLADQLSKHLVRAFKPQLAFGPFHLEFVSNTGAAFGLLPNTSFILALVGVAILAGLAYFYVKMPASSLFAIALAAVAAGTLGNIIDRLFFGYVTDFIGIWIWPSFNIADSALTLGAIALAAFFWKSG